MELVGGGGQGDRKGPRRNSQLVEHSGVDFAPLDITAKCQLMVAIAERCVHTPFPGLHHAAFPALEAKRLAVQAYLWLRTFDLQIQEQHE